MQLISRADKQEQLEAYATLFLDAVSREAVEEVGEMLKNYRPFQIQHNPLHLAVARQNAKMLELLLQTGFFEVNDRQNKQSLLHRAVGMKNMEITKMLLGAKIDANMQNECGQTALHMAAVAGAPDFVKLLEGVTDGKLIDMNGRTAAYYLGQEKFKYYLPKTTTEYHKVRDDPLFKVKTFKVGAGKKKKPAPPKKKPGQK